MQITLAAFGLFALLSLGAEGLNQAVLEKMLVAQTLETAAPSPAPTTEPAVPMPLAPVMEPRPIMPPPAYQPGAQDFSGQPNQFFAPQQPPPPPQPFQGNQFSPQFPPQGGEFQQQGTQIFDRFFQPQQFIPSGGESGGGRRNDFQQPRQPMFEQNNQSERSGQPRPMPQNDNNFEGGEGEFEEQQPTVNPQEVKQVLRDVNQIERQLKSLAGKLRRLKNAGDEQNRVSELLSVMSRIKSALQSGSLDSDEVIEALEEYHDGDFMQEVQQLQLKVQLPGEIKQFTKTLSRAEKIVSQRAVQSLGLDLGRAKNDLAAMRQRLNEADADYKAGNFEDAMETLQDLRDGQSPVDIENAIMRYREVSRRVKALKNGGAEQLKTALQQAIILFNNGEYREARMLLEQQGRVLRNGNQPQR